MKLVSIIVPIYKVEDYLNRCVESIINQTYTHFELILVDDGSPDNCGNLCDEYKRKDNRIRVVHKENGGLSDARNVGYEIAKGEYIAFIDSDDWITPDYLEKLVSTMEYTDCDIVECEIIRTSNSNESVESQADVKRDIYGTQEALRLLISDNIFHQYVWNKLYKKDVIGNIHFEKGKINEDEFWTYQIFGNANKITKIDTILYYYFQRESSIMGAGYNLKRLHALEAKAIRQDYIESHFSILQGISAKNLFYSCMYSGQMSMMFLKRDELEIAKNKIDEILKRKWNWRAIYKELSFKDRIWFRLARVNFWHTCNIRNRKNVGV